MKAQGLFTGRGLLLCLFSVRARILLSRILLEKKNDFGIFATLVLTMKGKGERYA